MAGDFWSDIQKSRQAQKDAARSAEQERLRQEQAARAQHAQSEREFIERLRRAEQILYGLLRNVEANDPRIQKARAHEVVTYGGTFSNGTSPGAELRWGNKLHFTAEDKRRLREYFEANDRYALAKPGLFGGRPPYPTYPSIEDVSYSSVAIVIYLPYWTRGKVSFGPNEKRDENLRVYETSDEYGKVRANYVLDELFANPRIIAPAVANALSSARPISRQLSAQDIGFVSAVKSEPSSSPPIYGLDHPSR